MQSKIQVSPLHLNPLQKRRPQVTLNSDHIFIPPKTHDKDNRALLIEDKFNHLKNNGNNFGKTRTKTQYYCSESQFVSAKDSKVEKLKQLDQLKMSNIDDLNYKISKLINKLSTQESPNQSMVSQKQSHIRFKTQYSSVKEQDYSQKMSNVSNNSKKNEFDMGNYEKYLTESKVINQVFTPSKNNENKNSSIHKHQLASIKEKYQKNVNNLNRTESCKGIQIKSVLLSNNKYNPRCQQPQIKNKQKENKKKQVCSISMLIDQKQNLCRPFGKNKKNINQEYQAYTKKIDQYKNKRQQLQECKNSKIPLKNIENQLNSMHQSFRKQIQPFTHEFNQYPCFNATIKQQQESQPPTADFRKPQESNSNQNFISHLIKQIHLDEIFRKAKKWFQKNNSSYKWIQLAKTLKQKKVYFDQNSIHQIFTLHQQQENPFYSSREKQFNLESLVSAFLTCQEHWFQNIVKKYNKQNLAECGFTQNKMDISRKGYLQIQDFVRFLNIERNVQVRNRDLFLIFERLRSQQTLTFRGLIQVICE